MTSILVYMEHEGSAYYYPGRKPKAYEDKNSMINANRRQVGEFSLCCAVIEQALQDYFVLVRRGAMRMGELVGKWDDKTDKQRRPGTNKQDSKSHIAGITRSDAVLLLEFLRNLETYADAIELRLDWKNAWEKILELERSGRYRGGLDA